MPPRKKRKKQEKTIEEVEDEFFTSPFETFLTEDEVVPGTEPTTFGENAQGIREHRVDNPEFEIYDPVELQKWVDARTAARDAIPQPLNPPPNPAEVSSE